MDSSALLAIRSSVGVEFWSSSGPQKPYEPREQPREETKNSRSITFSPNGRFFAYTNGQEVKVLQAEQNWGLQCTLPRPKALYLQFSPQSNYLCTWELFVITKDRPEGGPNMFVYDLLNGGKEVLAVVQKIQTDWEPSWAMDESIFAFVVGGEAHFYDLADGTDGFIKPARKVGGLRGGTLSLGPGSSPPYLAFYTPGVKGAPSMCKLYKYPAVAQNQAVSCKSFFQADRVELLWNKRGTGLLLLTSTEVDKSGASYYGNQALHFMNTKGDSCSVPLSKDGPVHCVKWSPKATEFVVVYGYMPSKAALYNLKCDVIFDFGEGPRNCAYFNPFGNLVVLAGFGNLPGNVEIWDVNKKEQLANIKCPDTTLFDWSPNGEYFVTATTAPRLRIGNVFKVYHYSGSLMHETIWPKNQELLDVVWQQFPENTFSEPIITKIKHEGIKSSQPVASKNAYTPPHLRGGKDAEKYIPQPQSTIPGLPPGYSSAHGNNKKGGARSNGQKYNNPKNKKHEANANNNDGNNGGAGGNVSGGVDGAGNQLDNRRNDDGGKAAKQKSSQRRLQRSHNRMQEYLKKITQQNQETPNNGDADAAVAETSATFATTGENVANEDVGNQQQQDSANQKQQKQQSLAQSSKKPINPEKEKKIRNVAKKLSDIKKLKERMNAGEMLEINQMTKIGMEMRFLEELKALKLST